MSVVKEVMQTAGLPDNFHPLQRKGLAIQLQEMNPSKVLNVQGDGHYYSPLNHFSTTSPGGQLATRAAWDPYSS